MAEVVLGWSACRQTVLLALTAQRPGLLIVEDLHWIDPSTLELLTLFLDQGPTARVLTLLTCRPEFRAPWGFCAHLTFLTLSRLLPTETEVMVARVVGRKALPPEVAQQVVAKADGVPLFVEELTKMMLESGLLQEQEHQYELRGPLSSSAIPATLHDSLMARLDRLAVAKEVAQLGATLGRVFPYELLQAVSPWDEQTLQQALARLVEAELLYQHGVPPQATYRFKHALIQGAAYQSLLKSTRQHYHRQIAQVLEARFPEIRATQPALVAQHYTEAVLTGQALGYWQRAGERAIQRSAYVEAISHLTKGLELLTALPNTPERAQRELDLQITLGPAFMVIKGWGAAEVERVYTPARELCEQVGHTRQLLRALNGLHAFHLVRANIQTAWELGEQFFRIAQRVQDPQALLWAHYELGETSFYRGEFASPRAHFEQGMAFYASQQHNPRAMGSPDPGMACVAWAAHALWVLGYPDQASTRMEEAHTLAQELSHPLTSHTP